MSLPFWPGYCFDRNLGKKNHSRIQILDKRSGVIHTYDDDKLLHRNETPSKMLYEPRVPNGPSWIVNDKKVLCFDGYWLESVVDNPDEKYRSRNCKVLFYLEDDTIHVLEPRIRNSSLAQGTIVKRRKMLKPPPHDNQFYTVHDLNIGELIYLCGRCIKLVSCDKFTNYYLRRLGVKIPYPIEPPLDPRQLTKIIDNQNKGKGYYQHSNSLNQFLDHNKHILRFYCFYDSSEHNTDPRSMTLHYFVEDDTIEIIENLPRNCGREGKLFLRRQKLPKNYISNGLTFPHNLSDPAYLNVIKTSKFHHKTIDSLDLGNAIDCYKDDDLSLGNYINVLGMKFMLCDCDEFTKEYYRKKYGILNFKSIDMSQYWKQGETITKFIAPHNGWGSEEDSILNCFSIRPSETIISGKKFMGMKRTIDDLMVLRFLCIINNPKTAFDKQRRFIISYRIEDDKLYINEQSNEKPGFNFTSFLNRNKHMKPKRLRRDIHVPEYYKANDFYLGALIELNGLVLQIILVDDYTLKYMETHAHTFIYSSLERILNKLRKHLSNKKGDVEYFFKNEDPLSTGLVNYTSMKLFKNTHANDFLIDQELVTLSRLYGEKSDEKNIHVNRKIAEIRQKLREHIFMDYYLIKEHWYAMSPHSTSLHILKARSILKGLQLPLTDEMLCDLLKLSQIDSKEEVELCALLDIIEWQKFQPDYFNKVGKFLECKENIKIIETLKLAELLPEKTLNIGKILWKILFSDIYMPSKSSKLHPDTQRMVQSAHCIETYE